MTNDCILVLAWRRGISMLADKHLYGLVASRKLATIADPLRTLTRTLPCASAAAMSMPCCGATSMVSLPLPLLRNDNMQMHCFTLQACLHLFNLVGRDIGCASLFRKFPERCVISWMYIRGCTSCVRRLYMISLARVYMVESVHNHRVFGNRDVFMAFGWGLMRL